MRVLTSPVPAFILFNADIYLWHVPYLYDLTLQNQNVHVLEHLTFIAAGMIVWCPVLNPVREMRLSHPGQLLFLFANLFPGMALGIVFSFYPQPLYSPYLHDPRLWGIPVLIDQQIGGLIMWMPGNIPDLVAMMMILVIWLDRGRPAMAAKSTLDSPVTTGT